MLGGMFLFKKMGHGRLQGTTGTKQGQGGHMSSTGKVLVMGKGVNAVSGQVPLLKSGAAPGSPRHAGRGVFGRGVFAQEGIA